MERLVAHLTEKYRPLAMVVYGSYATGDQRAESDFDALLITEGTEAHDTEMIGGVRLDAWVYPRAWAEELADGDAVIQLHGGRVLLDTDGLAARLIALARAHAAAYQPPSQEEKRQLLAWYEKMAQRARRGDAEGLYRWHWLMQDSLQVYCDVRDRFCFGPGKTLRAMRLEDPDALRFYEAAMRSPEALEAWIARLFAPLRQAE